MTTKDDLAPAEPLYVLHSAGGLAGTDWEHGDLAGLESCEKIVLGRPDEEQDGTLPNGIRSWPRGLKVLHLWGLADLERLPPFDDCPELETIDVSGCTNLEVLPPIDQLERLEWLDGKGCAALTALPPNPPATLRFLYLDGCTGLSHEELVGFLHALGRDGAVPQLVELDLSGTRLERLPHFTWRAYWAPESMGELDHRSRWESRRWLEKIVLRDCAELTKIALPLDRLPNLRHVNVAGCGKLTALPTLPVVPAYPPPWPQKVLQYLQVDGSKIEEHAEASVRGRHRKEGDNVPGTHRNAAETFLALQHFGDPVPFPECRLMVLGNSMAGKTALIRRLMYGLEGADPPGYVEPEGGREAWKPRRGMGSTHPIHCPTWRVGLDGFDEPATVHVWDYGGQHKYHRSHRNFVREGSLFLLVWRHPSSSLSPEDLERNRELLQEEETPHTLKYWLDFIVACGVCPPEKLAEHVVIVCTQSDGHYGEDLTRALGDELGEYADKGLRLDHTVESMDLTPGDELAANRWRNFFADLRGRLGGSIERNGSNVPRFFVQVAERVSADRRSCEEANAAWNEGKDPGMDHAAYRARAFPSEAEWKQVLEGERRGPVESPHARAITRNLHETGSLFWLHPPGRPRDRRVIVDQGEALEWVYKFFDKKQTKRFQRHCRESGGRFTRADLLRDTKLGEAPQRLLDAWQEDLALDIMRQCRLILANGDGFLATEDALLPDLGDVPTAAVHARRRAWRTDAKSVRQGLEGTKDHPVGQGVFQDFRAWFLHELKGRLKTETFHLYRSGFQVEVRGPEDWDVLDPERRADWPERFLLEIAWVSFEPGAYGGKVHVRIDAPGEADAQALWEQLNGEQGMWRAQGCPLGGNLQGGESGDVPFLLLDAESRGVFPVGISCRRANPVAGELYEHLMGLDPPHPTFYYCGEEILEAIGEDHTERVLGKLGASQVMVLLIDEAYLEPAEKNRYCLEELAMAAFRFDPANWRKLERRLSRVDPDLPETCEARLGRIYVNAKHERERARTHTLVFLQKVRREKLSGAVRTALASLHALLVQSCEPLESSASPRWFFKRELVAVLIEDDGLARFNTELAEVDAAFSDVEVLKRRLEELARGLDDV